jgi:L-threonylcarbamoyladenylate synthase
MRMLRVADDASRQAALAEGARVLRAGGLVAFPTETVYGLGAHALDADAVQRIYEAKGRPAVNPIIVHVASLGAARALASDWTPAAEKIAQAFWPGPVTIVVRKRAEVPAIVTAGGDTVGLRIPAHPIALALLEQAGVPVAAPSANLSTQVSPTTAQHVERGLGDRVDLIIDGGPTTVGIESTVVDATGETPRVLRPGMIARHDIARVAGAADGGEFPVDEFPVDEERPRSPGMMAKHYAPRARVVLLDRAALLRRLADESGRTGVIAFGPVDAATVEIMPGDPAGYARRLYAALHALDEARCEIILVERPPASAEWAAIRDRLQRAAT